MIWSTSCDYRIGKDVDGAVLDTRISEVIDDLVALQVENGVDVVNDGEAGKMSYHVYAKHRLTGLGNANGEGVLGRKTREISRFS